MEKILCNSEIICLFCGNEMKINWDENISYYK